MPKNTNLPPETTQEIIALANDMTNVFAPPELIPGCEVLSISDKDQYDTNNGWIEAICGQHNNQRCRWKGKFAGVQVGDYVDVLYFKSAKLFDVLAKGGTGAITPGGGNVWPLAGEANIGATSYATISDGIDALSSGDQLIIGEGSYTTDWSGGHAGIPTGADVKGSGVDVTVLTDADSYVLEVEGQSLVEQLTVTNTTTTGGAAILQDTGGDGRYDTVKAVSAASSGTAIGFNIFDGDAVLVNCEAEATGGASNYALWGYDSGTGTTIEIRGGKFTGDIRADQAGCTIHLDGPTITGSVTEANSGTITGHYYNAGGDHIFKDGSDIYPDGDTAGLFERVNVWIPDYIIDVPKELGAATLSWDAVNFSGTPSSIDVSGKQSLAQISHNVANTNFFAYKTLASTSPVLMYARCGIGSLDTTQYAYSGIRIDNPSAPTTNFFELRLVPSTTTAGCFTITFRYDNGGGVTATDYATTIPAGFYWFGLYYDDSTNLGLGYYSFNGPPTFIGANSGATWTSATARSGIIYGMVGVSANILGLFD